MVTSSSIFVTLRQPTFPGKPGLAIFTTGDVFFFDCRSVDISMRTFRGPQISLRSKRRILTYNRDLPVLSHCSWPAVPSSFLSPTWSHRGSRFGTPRQLRFQLYYPQFGVEVWSHVSLYSCQIGSSSNTQPAYVIVKPFWHFRRLKEYSCHDHR